MSLNKKIHTSIWSDFNDVTYALLIYAETWLSLSIIIVKH